MSIEPKPVSEPKQDGPAPAAGEGPSEDERNMAMVCHAGGILTWFVIPLVVWQLKKGQSAFVDEHAKEALNFQLTLLIGDVVALLVMFTVSGALGAFLWLPVLIARVGLGIMGIMAATAGKPFRYVVNARFIR